MSNVSQHSDPDQPVGRDPRSPGEIVAVQGAPLAAESLHLREIVDILRRRLWLILAISGLLVGTVALWLSRQPVVYLAKSVVLISDARRSLTGELSGETPQQTVGRYTDPILSRIEILRGRTVLGKVVDRTGLRVVSLSDEFRVGSLAEVQVLEGATADSLHLHFREDGVEVIGRTAEARAGYGTPLEVEGVRLLVRERPAVASAAVAVLPRERAISMLAGSFHAAPRQGTDVVEITYRSADPVRSVQVANALAEAFQQHDAETAQQQSRRRRVFLEAQLRDADSLLAEAQYALSTFQRTEQVYSSADKFAAQQQALMGLEIRREELEADYRMYQSLLGRLQRASAGERGRALRTLVSSPGVASNPVISQLYTQLVQYEQSRDDLTTGPLASTAANPDVARLTTLIAATETKLSDAIRSHAGSLAARIAALNDLRARSTAEMQQLPAAEAEQARLAQQVTIMSEMVNQLRTDLHRARISEAVETGQVEIVNLAPWAEEAGTSWSTMLSLALILGLVFGSATAFGAELLNSSIRRRREVESMLNVPGLVTIPRIGSPGDKRRGLRLPLHSPKHHHRAEGGDALAAPDAPGAEAFRRLRNSLLFSQGMQELRTLTVTSSMPGEGKTLTAANLALALAQQGRRVLVVDGDLHRSRMHRVFRQEVGPGLIDVLQRRVAVAEAIHPTTVGSLYLLPSGVASGNTLDLLEDHTLRKILAVVADQFDLVIVDAPPVLAAADAAVLAAATDGVLLVVRAGVTRRDTAQRAAHELTRVGATIVGAALNDPDDKLVGDAESEYYAYGYAQPA